MAYVVAMMGFGQEAFALQTQTLLGTVPGYLQLAAGCMLRRPWSTGESWLVAKTSSHIGASFPDRPFRSTGEAHEQRTVFNSVCHSIMT